MVAVPFETSEPAGEVTPHRCSAVRRSVLAAHRLSAALNSGLSIAIAAWLSRGSPAGANAFCDLRLHEPRLLRLRPHLCEERPEEGVVGLVVDPDIAHERARESRRLLQPPPAVLKL